MEITTLIAVFIAGVAFGIAWHRKFIERILNRKAWTKCDYCEYEREKKKLFP